MEDLSISESTFKRYVKDIENLGFKVVRDGKYYHIDKDCSCFKMIIECILPGEKQIDLFNSNFNELSSQQKSEIVEHIEYHSYYRHLISQYIQKRTIDNIGKLTEAINQKKSVKIINYHSSNSNNIRNRIVEAFQITEDYGFVFCYDHESHKNKVFKIARIEDIEILDDWRYDYNHTAQFMDVFSMTGDSLTECKLKLNLMSKNLLCERFPSAEKHIKKQDDNVYMAEFSYSRIEGISNFIMSVLDSVEIIYPSSLQDSINEKINSYLHSHSFTS
jgi:predicted DNA-binding transcriptional regulator YafY